MAGIITETPIDEFISRFRSNAEHQRKIGDLHGCLEFRQLADTLEKYQKIEQIIDDWNNGKFSDAVGCLRVKAVVEDGKRRYR